MHWARDYVVILTILTVILQALVATGDGRYIITGGFAGVVRVFYTHNLRLKYNHESFGSSIRSLHVPADQK